MFVLKNGAVSTLAIIDGVKKKSAGDEADACLSNLVLTAIGDQLDLHQRGDQAASSREGHCRRSSPALMISALSRQFPLDP